MLRKYFASHFIVLFLKFFYLVYDSFLRKSVNQRATFCIVCVRLRACIRSRSRVNVCSQFQTFYEVLQIVRLQTFSQKLNLVIIIVIIIKNLNRNREEMKT